MKKLPTKSFTKWLPFAVAVTLIYGATYAVIQQNYRASADDPQIQYVEDITNILEGGQVKPENIVGQDKIDPEKSLATFIIIFDKDKKAVASSATVSDGIPIPPKGTFDQKKVNFFGLLGPAVQNRFTWEPKKNVRIAAVLTKYKDGYILAGRSLREVEQRIKMLGVSVAIAWVATFLATFIAIVFTKGLRKAPENKPED